MEEALLNIRDRIPEQKYLELKLALAKLLPAQGKSKVLKSGAVTAEIKGDRLIVTWHNGATAVYDQDGILLSPNETLLGL